MAHRAFRAALLVLSLGVCSSGGDAREKSPKVHVVAPGHTLGKIAKRYRVSIDAICAANAIRRNEAIRPGQKLVIPDRDDPDGQKARKVAQAERPSPKAEAAPPARKADQPKVHVVYPGHTLGKIAKRYNVSIDALCNANGLGRGAVLKPKQRLIVPSPDDEDGSEAKVLKQRGYVEDDRASGRSSDGARDGWRRYAKPPWRRGFITLKSGDKEWRGYVVGPKEAVLPAAAEHISEVLASWRTGKSVAIDRELIRLIAKVSDTFGGRPIRVVSGFREHSTIPSSRHPHGRALDFSIEGVPNEAVRDYLRSLDHTGVGYYPNSTFVHMDVRPARAYWVDHSGPGEPPN